MKVFIIEDEPLGVERLSKQLREIDGSIEIVGFTESIKESVKWLNEQEAPDLIFVDIELADGQSFEIFKNTKVKSAVIFTTSYDEYALQAFKINSIDYLLKPINKEELRQAVNKFKQIREHYGANNINIEKLLNGIKKQDVTPYRGRFLVKQGQRYASIDITDVAYFYLEDRVTFLKTKDNLRYVIDYSLDELEPMLNPRDFGRVSRQFIVYIKAIQEIHSYFKGRLKLELMPPLEKEVIVSQENASEFKKWLGK